MSEKFVIVHRSYDPILIEHLAEMLREADVTVRAVGTRDAALIGMGSSIAELHLSVPQSQAAEASDFLEAFCEQEGELLLEREGLLDGDEDEDEDEDNAGGEDKLSGALAGIAVLFCGLGHVYARRRVTGALLALSFIALFIAMLGALGPNSRVSIGELSFNPAGFPLAIAILMILDFVGAQRATREFNRGLTRGPLYQVVAGLAFVAIALGVGCIPSLGRPLDKAMSPEFSIGDIERELERRSQPNPLDPFGFDDIAIPGHTGGLVVP